MFKYLKNKVMNYGWYDLPLIKLSVFAFTLMVAKLYPAVLGFDWYVYLIFAAIFAFSPLVKLLK